jgi:hypothetical protein
MVFVTVGENYCGDVVAILFEEVEIRNANVNAVSGLFRKAHSGVEDEHLILITHSHAIHPKLADTAERNDLYDTTHFSSLLYSPSKPNGFRSLSGIMGPQQAKQYTTRYREELR